MDELDAICRQYPPDHFRRAVSRLIQPSRLQVVAPPKETIDQAIARARRQRFAAAA